MVRAVRAAGWGVASLSLASVYGLGGMVEPEVACLSFDGAAFTVSLSDCLLPAGVRDNDAVEGWDEGLLLRVSVLIYGLAASRATVEEAVRVERRVGGIVAVVWNWCRRRFGSGRGVARNG